MYISKTKRKIIVSCPYNKDFIEESHKLKGKWLPGSKTWSFSLDQEQGVLLAVEKTFGRVPDQSILG